MERVKVLIDKLIQQQQRNEGVEAMLVTTQLLQNELLLIQKRNTSPVTKKVTVVMPSNPNPVLNREPKSMKAPEKTEEVSIPEEKEMPSPVQHVEETFQNTAKPVAQGHPIPPPIYRVPPVPHMNPVAEVPKAVEQPGQELPNFNEEKAQESVPNIPPVVTAAERPEHEPYLPPKQKIQETAPEPEKIVHPLVMDNHFDAIEEAPTLTQYQPPKKDLKLQKEINDLVGESKETLNDRLKENKKELAHVLKETPIKDLRKAIGVNDRFVFVNELFRGDETMYERSIKTINGFHILPEAEYWINRELKVKLGWDDYKDSVQHFYHLVRRRFS
ncbi:hypothetical protein OCK74_02780 [Chitinophagaceae bacterium LB-8]|uniref:Uncharacterized protein n=1 Tax=Paraflavisolibacter caeni TaxID=2982496 RepID=A0A9X3BGR4_9BACT|nr:hypothetical protein [Paraflavisolibacter caeni]MCU7548018.1 hypothetical protein [Paraflavisolibacter caeni]